MRRILTASDRALLVESDDLETSMRLHAALQAEPIDGVEELVPGARTILVRYQPLRIDAAGLTERIAATRAADDHGRSEHSVTIPVRYDGDDLHEVAGLLGMSADEVIARHLAATWQVAFTGFAPGFGYIVGDDSRLDVPRRESPRTRIPAGSVALAGTFTGVYPRESPGGWQLIGRTDAEMWRIDRDPPALLAPGTSVRFERAEPDAVAVRHGVAGHSVEARQSVEARHGAAPTVEPSIEVLRPGLQLLVQDAGRPGHAGLGVSQSGAADRGALARANRAVGNDAATAGLESAGGGVVLRWHAVTVAAITGALVEATLVDAEGRSTTPAHGSPFAVEDGDELRLGPTLDGMRCMLGVRGGIDADPALGSRATDTLAGVGPSALAAGDVVRLGRASEAPSATEAPTAPRTQLPTSDDLVRLDIVLGPRDDWFDEASIEMLTSQEWLVTPRSDRVGIRLHGDAPLVRSRSGELPSEGAVTGAIQVPPDGQPVLFLPDHPLTGGYPIIGAVVDASLDLMAQLPPGARIRFDVTPGGRS